MICQIMRYLAGKLVQQCTTPALTGSKFCLLHTEINYSVICSIRDCQNPTEDSKNYYYNFCGTHASHAKCFRHRSILNICYIYLLHVTTTNIKKFNE